MKIKSFPLEKRPSVVAAPVDGADTPIDAVIFCMKPPEPTAGWLLLLANGLPSV